MFLKRILKRILTAISLATFCFGASASETGWPSKPVKIIVPYAAGGATDRTARLLSMQLTNSLGQPFVVENRAGGGGNIGTGAAANAAPDGYTFVLAYAGPFGINPYIHKEALPFDPIKDFAPVTLVAEAPLVMSINGTIPATDLESFIKYAKDSGADIFCGASGVGGADYLACSEFNKLASIDSKAVPYKGGAPAMLDLVAGRTQLQFATIPGALPHIRSGAIRPLAILSNGRSALFPEVPTIKEAGFDNFEVNNWYGIAAPAGTPDSVIEKLNAHLVMALQSAEVQENFSSLGLVPIWNTPSEFGEFIVKDSARWKSMVEGANIQ